MLGIAIPTIRKEGPFFCCILTERIIVMSLPKIENYGKYNSDNYGRHCLKVTMERLTVWFSYNTPVAYQSNSSPIVVRQNDWGTTTGKHLNWIDGGNKKDRIPGKQFESQLYGT
ncbi:hypothetical protein LCGC14_2651560 [marine sediment metagenome]|uniref:DUF8033 domain-containing protein n=1 Tax=marine sediment metagenome TaxID=412755 RepID=A0A0F9C4Z9_9ZZZZ